MLAVRTGISRQDVEPDGGILGATNQGHDVVDTPAENLSESSIALGDADNPVTHLELARQAGGAAGHDFADHGVFVA